jgi:hypothetical protein
VIGSPWVQNALSCVDVVTGWRDSVKMARDALVFLGIPHGSILRSIENARMSDLSRGIHIPIGE